MHAQMCECSRMVSQQLPNVRLSDHRYLNVTVFWLASSVLRARVHLVDWFHLLDIVCWVLKVLLVNGWAITNVMVGDGMCVFHMTFWLLDAP